MIRHFLRAATLFAALLSASASQADPLHPLAGDSYWHHESNFVFPATLAGFTRAGAPQELDGSTTVTAYYALGAGDARLVAVVEVMPLEGAPPESARPDAGRFVRVIDRAGWRVVIRANLPDEADAARVAALVDALRIDRLGAVDTRCPNAGCGT